MFTWICPQCGEKSFRVTPNVRDAPKSWPDGRNAPPDRPQPAPQPQPAAQQASPAPLPVARRPRRRRCLAHAPAHSLMDAPSTWAPPPRPIAASAAGTATRRAGCLLHQQQQEEECSAVAGSDPGDPGDGGGSSRFTNTSANATAHPRLHRGARKSARRPPPAIPSRSTLKSSRYA